MKLHLPNALFAAVVAACMAYPAAQAADIGNSYDSTYTYGGTVYTFSGSVPGDGTVTQYVSDTTRTPAEGTPTGWSVGTASTTASDNSDTIAWNNIYNGQFNTLRLTENKVYSYKFELFTMAGVIVEKGADGASFQPGSDAKRSITIGEADKTSNSYFGGSFTFNNAVATNDNSCFDGSVMKLQGTQAWYIADDKTVTLTSKNSVVNEAAWTINGGTVAINHTIDNTNGSITAGSTTFQINNLESLKHTIAEGWGDSLEQNGAVTLSATYTIADGGTVALTGSQLKYTADGSEQTQALTGGSFSKERVGYGVASNTTLADIAGAVNNGGGSYIAIKDGVTLSRGEGASFTTAQMLTGSGKYDRGEIEANDSTEVVLNSNLILDSTWTGTVSISGGNGASNANANSVAYIDFDVFGNAQSTVEISEAGLFCYLTNGDKTFETNILLNGNLTIHNGNSGFAHTFAGTISGEKDIVLNRSGGGANDYTFSNNISEWKGALKAIANTNNVTLNGNATEVNAIITNTEGNKTGTLNLTVNNSGKTTTFNKNVTVNKLTGTTAIALGEGVALTLTGSNEVSNISNLTAHTNGNTITLNQGATLNRIATKSGGTVTLKGAGTYNMSGSPTSNVSGLTAETWTGKVAVSGNMGNNNGLDFSVLGNANSTIEVTSAGVTGFLCSGVQTITSNIVMSGNVALSNGYSTSKKTFAGAVSGAGNFTLAYNNGNATDANFFPQEWNFSGDVSEWNGEFAVQDVANRQASKGTLKFSGTSEINLTSIAAKKADGAEGAARSELHVTISDADQVSTSSDADQGSNAGQSSTKSSVSVASTIDATTLTTNTEKGVVLNNAVTVNTLTVQSGTVTGSGNVTVNNTLTLNAADSINLTGSLVFGDGATLTLGDSLIQTIVNGDATSYTLATAGSISEGVQLTSALNLDGSKFTAYELAVQDITTPAARSGDAGSTQALVLTLTPAATTPELVEITVNGGSYADGVLTFTTEEDLSAGLAAEFSIKFNENTWKSILADNPDMAPEISVALDGINWTDEGVTMLTINGEGPKGGQLSISSDGVAAGTFVTAYIPEPTTSTLSLLALAALAVRRRRK